MKWFVVRDYSGKCLYAHFDRGAARDFLWRDPRAIVMTSHNANAILGWIACIIVFGGIGMLLAWRG